MLQARRRRKFGKLYVLLLQIVRSFSICTEKIDYFSGAHWAPQKIRILRVKIRRLSTLKLKLSFLVSVAPSEPKNFRLVHLTPGINRNGTL